MVEIILAMRAGAKRFLGNSSGFRRARSGGGVGGFMHAFSNISGIFASSITGIIVQVTHQFTSAFLLSSGILVLGSLSIALFAKPIREMAPEAAMIART